MTRNHIKSEQGSCKLRLLEEYKNVESATDSVPTLAQLEEHGAYSADEFRTTFGSHHALVEAAQQPRNQILVAIRRERSKRGHTPKLSDVRESERENVSDVWEYFDTWSEALEAAEVLPTTDEIVEAIKREQANLGRIPNSDDFLDRTRYRQIDYLHHFESWDDALLAAEFDVDEDELYSEIGRVTDELGQIPTLAKFGEVAPSAYAMYQRSDRSWMGTLDDAGVLPSRDDIIREINRVAEKMDRFPNAGEFTDRTNIRSKVYQHHLGNWTTALDAAGVLPTKNELVDHIRALSDKLEVIPSQSNLLEKSKYPKSVYDYHFDSWKAAVTAAGLLPSKEELASQIRIVSEATESIPSREVVVERGDYGVQVYEFQFSSWEKALEAAGVLPSQAEFLSLVRSAGSESGWVDQDAVYRKDALPSEYHAQFFDSWEATLDAAGLLLSEEEFLSLLRSADDATWWLDEYEFYQTTDLPNDYHTLFFDSWAEALVTAGIAPTREEFLSMVQEMNPDRHWVNKNQVYEVARIPTDYHTQFFDSWGEALETAGIAPTKKELLSMVKEAKTDRHWASREQVYEGTRIPTDYHTRFFDSWDEMLDAADLHLDEQQFLSILRETEVDGEWINQRRFYAETALPSGYHARFFNSWVEALDAAGILPSKEELLQHLRDLETELDHIPSRSEAIEEGNYQGSIYRFRLGSWNETLDAAGLLPTKEELIEKLRTLRDDLGPIPSKSDVSESGKHQLDIYRRRFGSWGDALETAGLLDEELFIAEVKQVVAEQGPVVTPDDVYDASGIPEGYHERFYDSWEEVLEATGALGGALPAPIEERLHDLATEWGRPPSEEYARRHLGINTRATFSDAPRIALDWEAMLDATGLDSGDVDPDADLIKEIEQLADTLEHRPNRTEVEKYLLEESNYVANHWEIDDAIEQATIPAKRDLTPTRSLTRQRYERNSGDIPSHTDLLVELNIIRSRTKSDKGAIESAFETRGVIDEQHYSIQFGSVAAAVDELLAIDTRQFVEPIERNYSLTPGMLRESVRELGEILERSPLLEEVVFLGEASIADFAETFDSWAEVTDTDSIVQSWSNEQLLDNVEEVGRNLGKPPTHEELLEFGAVPVQCLVRRFGIWPRVLGLLGVDVDAIPHEYLAYEFTSELWNTTDYLVREEYGHDHTLFDELHRLSFEFDCAPFEELIQRYSPYAIEKFTREFESITAATNRAGITTSDSGRPSTPSREEFLRDLQTVSETATIWVLPQDISLHSQYSVGTYIGAFDSLENALEQANLPTDHLVGPTETYSDAWHTEHQMKAAVLRAIADLASRDENEVTMARLQSVTGISDNVVYRFFDDWDEAREAAQVRESLGTVEVDPDKVENPDFVDDLLNEMDEMMEEY